MDDPKSVERTEARARRKAIAAPARREKEVRIRAAVHALPEMKRASLVACYVGVHSEVDTRVLLEELLMQDVRVAVPVLDARGMTLAEVESLGDLVAGAHGIPEPRPPHAALDAAPDVFLVPGLRFTRAGHRLGNGGGHFDRALRAEPQATRVGLAYAEQMVDALPLEPHDERMDVVVTDAGVHRGAPRG